jgi:uroporphyrinogen-III synthase
MKALVTRPIEDAGGLLAALAERGIGALLEPMIEIRFSSGPAPDLEGVQAILATSANGVRALARLSPMRKVPLLAVGDATAQAARALGFANVASAAGARSDLLALACRRLEPQSGRLVHVAGNAFAGDLKGELEARGFAVDRVELYEARLSSSLSREAALALASGGLDFAFFFSPRTASAFAGLAEAAGVDTHLRAIRAFSLSPATDAALVRLAWRERCVAARPNLLALLEALDIVLRR